MKPFLRRLWRAWAEIAGYFGDFQARLILTIFYATILLPFALIMRLFADPLSVRKPPAKSGWMRRQQDDADLQATRRQF